MFAALTGLAVVGGPLVGGFIDGSLAWQWIFWVNVPIGVVLVPLVLARIDREPWPAQPTRRGRSGAGRRRRARHGVGDDPCQLRRLEQRRGDRRARRSAALLMAAFVRWELRVAEPMLPMRFFAERGFAAGNASAFLLYASLYGMVFYIAQYLQVSLGYSPFAAGLRFLPWTALMFVVAPASGRLADRVGGRPLVVLGLVLQGIGAGWIAVNASDGRPYTSSILALVISGVGLATAMPAVQNMVLNAVPPAAVGKASGTFNTLRQLGGVVGVALLAAVFSANGSYASPQTFGSGSGAALAVAAALAGAGAVTALFAPGRTGRRVPAAIAAVPVVVAEPARVG